MGKKEAKLQGKCEVGDICMTATSNPRALAGMTMHRLDCPKQHRGTDRSCISLKVSYHSGDLDLLSGLGCYKLQQ